MAGLTREQRAAKEAAKANAIAVEDKVLGVTEASKRTRIDPKEYAEHIRSNRQSSSGLEQKMKYYGENPGWKRRWVNDDNVPGRLAEGYRFVLKEEISMSDSVRYGNDDVANYVSQPVGGNNNRNEPMRAFLMEVPLEIADELLQEKSLSKVAKIEQSIKQGNIGLTDTRNMRIPDGVQIQLKT